MKSSIINGLLLIVLLCYLPAHAKNQQADASFISISGEILAAEDISAIAKFKQFLVIGSDEAVGKKSNKNYIQFLEPNPDKSYKVKKNILLLKGNKDKGKELDIEALAVEGNTLYAIGSHSSKRQKISYDRKYKKNHKKFFENKIKDEKNRDWLFKLELDENGNELNRQKISLREIFKKDPVLKAFHHLPGKENGIDIEGLGVKNGWLYIGFRGPVFRENYVPVLKLKFDDPQNYQLLYVNLAGRGIRDMCAVSNGFLILAGAVGDADLSYQLYFWDGKDIIPGKDREFADIGTLKLLGEIIPPEQAKAEGVTVLQENDSEYKLIITYDGVEDTSRIMQRLTIIKP